ncbi:Siroheme synthase [Granulosicoccus antarcticus IMCC3135]|uniref:Siroheme synthase n=2 Tax=Granulosicoccus TaxID=437504 RepID=A0A2Z2NS10_9GAMM|nr:Siroheme synthase [Granulosicoccus antarcticus IMCC3135]
MQGRRIIIVGGGGNAERKAGRLIQYGARVDVIAEQLSPTMQSCIEDNQLTHIARAWQADDFKGATLVVAASDERQSDAEVGAAAEAAGCWVNVANQPQLSNFLIPSLVDRSPILVAITSSGTSPVLARLLTARIDAFLPHSYSELGKLAERYRDQIRQKIGNWRQRRRFWEQLLNGRIGELILQGRTQNTDQVLEQAIQDYDGDSEAQGEVYLVGAGPGDPDLLSFRALRLMQQCDVVLYDRLVSEPVMSLVNQQAEKIYVGKQRSDHAVPQESINQLLVTHAKRGKRVLRLKGGDPFIFGRGGEEIETLASESVPFQVVPGITAAAGCASYAGIPLTHRDHAQSCLFVTGHLKDNSVDLDWPALTRAQQTVVIYMGLAGLPFICEQLIKHGLPSTHPIAIVSQGTLSNQQVITGTLSTLASLVESEAVKAPTLIIVGEVVTLRDKLAWFETRH